jgi:hypothetical protein
MKTSRSSCLRASIHAAIGMALLIYPVASFAGPCPDTDGDGIPDVCDLCMLDSRNAIAPYLDTDGDGYGNSCDGDFNQSGVTNTLDQATILSVIPPPLGTGNGAPTPDGTDMDGNGLVNFIDYELFLKNFKLGAPGPSGLSCAGTPGCVPPPCCGPPNLSTCSC